MTRTGTRLGLAGLLGLGFVFVHSMFGSRVQTTDFSVPLPGITSDEQARFNAGKDAFEEVEGIADGLGPVFNEVSCVACHNVGGTGGGNSKLEFRFGRITNGLFDPLTQFGGSLQQLQGIGDLGDGCEFHAESVGGGANVQAGRRTTPLFGLGLVDAVAGSTLEALAAVEPAATRGRVNRAMNLSTGKLAVSKFGWKAQVPTLFQFAGDAYLNEMGITNPQFPNESCMNGDCDYTNRCNPAPGLNDDGTDVREFRDFMTFLAPPARGPITGAVLAGEAVFVAIGCANCHTPVLKTAANAAEPSLRNRVFQPFSDFLLHDMGSLGDHIGGQGQAGLREMRTQPLWGLHLLTTFLHDGRASTIEGAVAAHDGQAVGARNRFNNLPAQQKANIMAFLKSL